MRKPGRNIGGARLWSLARAVALLLHTAGCAGAIQRAAAEAPRVATPVVIDETLKAFEGEPNRERVAAILGTPEMQRAMHELGSALGDGAMSNLSDEAATAHIEAFARSVAQVIARTLAAEAVSPDSQRAMQAAIRELVATATDQATRTLASEITTTLGPAVQMAIADGLRSPDMNEALGATTRTLSREAVIGTTTAVAEMQKQDGGLTIKGRIMRTLAHTWIAGVLLGALALALLVALFTLRARASRYKRERESVAALLRRTIKAAEGKPWATEMLELLSEHFHVET